VKHDATIALLNPKASTKGLLTKIVRDDAREMAGMAIEAGAAEKIAPIPTNARRLNHLSAFFIPGL